jgi:penicillin-binding protein 1C
MRRLLRIKGVRFGLGAAVAFPAAFVVLNALFPFPFEKLYPPTSSLVLDRNDEMLRAFLAPDEMWRLRVDAAEVSPAFRHAVIEYEDRRFYRHLGIDPKAVLRAMWANVRAGRVVQGGSTLSMQVTRLIEPKRRTLANKIGEAFRALQLEWRFSKEEIVTFYMNLAPYGGNVVGVAAASYLYFDKHPSQLTLGEAALLAAIPNNPNRYRPDVNPEAARRARDKVLQLLVAAGNITPTACAEALSEPLPTQRSDLPFHAPHLAVQLVRQRAGSERIETTIDLALQKLAARMLSTHLEPWTARGIQNGAVVIIDNETRDVLALVGSKAFFDDPSQGQVNAEIAPRSPGSALKPFVYALALERGVISPQRLLEDIPVDYRGYRPENYDRRYSGMVSADEALVRSLNVPAVNLAASLGRGGLYEFLRTAGLTTLTESREHYGLSLILGGCEVTLLEMTNLYAGLANGGVFRSCRVLKARRLAQGKRLFDQGTAYLVTEILSRLRRPELPAVWELATHMPKVAWKTGTSFGHRDAWSIGYTPRHTVGVWIGNMSGKGARALVGAEVAAPLLFDLFHRLESNASDHWFVRPSSLESREVCSVSGQPATERCSSVREEWHVPGLAPVRACAMHRWIWVDVKSGYRLCSRCRMGRSARRKVVTEWPAKLSGWLLRSGHSLDEIPEHLPTCSRLAVGEPPVILSPAANAEYRLRRGVKPEFQQILLEASASNRATRVYWFVNGEMVKHGDAAARTFMTPEPGLHTILCMDDEGRSSEIQIKIE